MILSLIGAIALLIYSVFKYAALEKDNSFRNYTAKGVFFGIIIVMVIFIFVIVAGLAKAFFVSYVI